VRHERAIFFERNDLCYGMGFERIESLEIPEYEAVTINDAIEFNEIKRYIDDGARAKNWTDEQYTEYKEKSKKLNGLCMRFFNSLSDSNIVQQYETIIDYDYRRSFWRLFDNCKLYDKISADTFNDLLHSKNISLYYVLLYENITKNYGEVIRQFILSDLNHVDLILRFSEQNYTKNQKLYLPDELTIDDISAYMISYIDSDNPNLNYLEDIERMRGDIKYPLPDEIRLKAKRKNAEKSKELFKKGSSFKYGINLSIAPNLGKERIIEYNHGITTAQYSKEWLLETLDYPSILNNFIYLFEYVDYQQMRCALVSKSSMSSATDLLFMSDSTRVYPDDHSFKNIDMLAFVTMAAYYDFLNNNGVRLEDVLEWFFTKYLQEEFSCPEMRVSFPSEGTTYGEKCVFICSALESVLKQYTLLVNNGEIDFELLQMSSGSRKFGDIPSFVENKYIYVNDGLLSNLNFELFSDQSHLTYIERISKNGRSYRSLAHLLLKEDVYLTDYRDDKHPVFRQLQENGLATIFEDGLIKLGDPIKLTILMDLYKNDVISLWHYPDEAIVVIKEWIDKGYLTAKSSLLSEPEVDYFNYYLNNADFVNGHELRNKYDHGIQQTITEEEHKHNYYILLRIFIILVIKINDDFTIKEGKKSFD
jgi:hypothetical protein